MQALIFLIVAFSSACTPTIPGISSKAQDTARTTRYLSQFSCVAGTAYQLATVQSSGDGYSSFNSGSSGSGTHNVLFMQAEGQFTKLFKSNDYRITGLHQFPNQGNSAFPGDPAFIAGCSSQAEKVEGFLYEVVKADSNGDNQITDADLTTLAISEANGQRYTELISNVQNLYGQAFQKQSNRLVIAYRNADGQYASVIDLATKKVISTNPLPDLGLK